MKEAILGIIFFIAVNAIGNTVVAAKPKLKYNRNYKVIRSIIQVGIFVVFFLA